MHRKHRSVYDGDGHVNDHDFCVSDSDAEIQDDDGVEEVFIHLENVPKDRFA